MIYAPPSASMITLDDLETLEFEERSKPIGVRIYPVIDRGSRKIRDDGVRDWKWLFRLLDANYERGPNGTRSYQKYFQAYMMLKKYAERPCDIQVEVAREFVREANNGKRANATVNSLITAAKVVCTKLVEEGVIRTNPFKTKDWSLPKTRNLRERKGAHLTVAEVRMLLARADEEAEEAKLANRSRKESGLVNEKFNAFRNRTLAWLVLHCGMRAEEALRLKLEDYNGRAVFIHGENHRAKKLKTDNSTRWTSVPTEAKVRLDEWINEFILGRAETWLFPGVKSGKPWRNGSHPWQATGSIAMLGVRAGLNTRAKLQTLRRTLNTHMVHRFGMTKQEAMLILGHHAEETQEYYTLTDHDDLDLLASKIDYGLANNSGL